MGYHEELIWGRGETAYASDLKSAAFGLVGSNPTAPTSTNEQGQAACLPFSDRKQRSMKRILLACGSGFATSTAARTRLERLLNEHGYEGRYEIHQCKIAEAARLSDSFDFLVATMMAPQHLGCPYVNGIPFLLGENMGPSERQVLQLMETPSCHLGTK